MIGVWNYSERVDPMTDEETASLILMSMDPPLVTLRMPPDPMNPVYLNVTCAHDRTDVFMQWNRSLTASDDQVALLHRLPPAEAFTAEWVHLGDGWVANPEAIPFLRLLLDQEELLVRGTLRDGTTLLVRFSLTGSREAISRIAEACNWTP